MKILRDAGIVKVYYDEDADKYRAYVLGAGWKSMRGKKVRRKAEKAGMEPDDWFVCRFLGLV